MTCRDLEGSSSGLTEVFLDLSTALRKNTIHTKAVPDEIRTTDLTSASKQHTKPLGNTVQTGVVTHTAVSYFMVPGTHIHNSFSSYSPVLSAQCSAKRSFCRAPFVQCRTHPIPYGALNLLLSLYVYSGVTQLSRSLYLRLPFGILIGKRGHFWY